MTGLLMVLQHGMFMLLTRFLFDSYLNGSNSSPWVWQDAVTISNNGFVTGGANNFIVFDSDCQPPGSVTSYKINGVYTPLGPCTDINNKPNTNDLGYNRG